VTASYHRYIVVISGFTGVIDYELNSVNDIMFLHNTCGFT